MKKYCKCNISLKKVLQYCKSCNKQYFANTLHDSYYQGPNLLEIIPSLHDFQWLFNKSKLLYYIAEHELFVSHYKFSALQFLQNLFCSINTSCYPLEGRFLCTNKISAQQFFDTCYCWWIAIAVVFSVVSVLLKLVINNGQNCQKLYPYICQWPVRL